MTPGAARFDVPVPLAELVADACWGLGATAIGETAGVLDVGFVTVDDATAAVHAVTARFTDVRGAVTEPDLDAALDAWREHARPERAGERFVVWPAWLPVEDTDVADVVVRIDPSRAFGSGSHPSTRLCLAALERIVVPGASVLDVGCGSGVLSVGAALLGAAPVDALDVDPSALAATADNASRNEVVVRVRDEPLDAVGERYDVVVANIGAATLLAMAPELAARVAPGGWLILAGILTAQVDPVAAAYSAAGCRRTPTRGGEAGVRAKRAAVAGAEAPGRRPSDPARLAVDVVWDDAGWAVVVLRSAIPTNPKESCP